MKKASFLSFFLLLTTHFFASVNAVLDYSTFFNPSTGPYVEVYLSINGNSLIYDSLGNDRFQAELQVGYLIKKKGTDETVNLTKFELKSPIYTSNSTAQNIIDVKRLSVPNGNYDLEIFLQDSNSQDSTTVVRAPLSVSYSTDSLQFSQLQLASDIQSTTENHSLVKHGIEFNPHPSAYFTEEKDKLAFYAELYNSEKILGLNEKFLLEFKVIDVETDNIANNIRGVMRENTQEIIPIIKSISIEELPSGNYELLIEARDKQNELLASTSKFFQRNNPAFLKKVNEDINSTFAGRYKDKEVITEYINSLHPISTEAEINFAEYQIENNGLENLQNYLYNFWYAKNSNDPEAAWEEYRQRVMYVNETYGSSIEEGYETDPGYVYLKYGKPSTITKSRFEPGAYPYQIWQYNQIDQRSNAKFVFYDNTGGMGEYVLLHSNVPNEITNYRWKAVIYGRTEQFKGTDKVDPANTYGKEVDDFFENPR